MRPSIIFPSLSLLLGLLFSLIFTSCQPAATGSKKADSTAAMDSTQMPEPEPMPTLSNSDDPRVILANYLGSTIKCGDSIVNFVGPIRHYADSISKLNNNGTGSILYNRATQDDCSGTFIKLNQYLDAMCSNYDFPRFDKQVRSTKQLVEYYNNKEMLVFIDNPLDNDSLIKPGTVMFYANSGTDKNIPINASNMKRMVQHVGVVTEVVYDSLDRVESYALFHGHNSRTKVIGITRDHFRVPTSSRAKDYPYGWFKQRWMAAAPIVNNDSTSLAAL